MIEPAPAIEVSGLTKTFGASRAVDDLSFTVEPGSVTGFLGPNGAGKTTTLRMVLGLVTPDAGHATIGGRAYCELPNPAATVGSALEATGFHPSRTGGDHLRVYCITSGFQRHRADEVLEIVDLDHAKHRKVGSYSLGMRQRLALAAALLGDPNVLILDEPANGLDPDGIVWMRHFLRDYADQGRVVLVSSHVLTEMQQLVDHVIILDRGRAIRQGSLAELSGTSTAVVVRTPHSDRLVDAITRGCHNGARAEQVGTDTVRVTDLAAADIGRLALAARIELHELTPRTSDLEQVFFALTGNHEGKNP